MRLRGSDIHIIIKRASNRCAWKEVEIRHIQEDTIDFRHPGVRNNLRRQKNKKKSLINSRE
jgi:hypothetical protein